MIASISPRTLKPNDAAFFTFTTTAATLARASGRSRLQASCLRRPGDMARQSVVTPDPSLGTVKLTTKLPKRPDRMGKVSAFAGSERPRQASAGRKKALTQHQSGGYGNARS